MLLWIQDSELSEFQSSLCSSEHSQPRLATIVKKNNHVCFTNNFFYSEMYVVDTHIHVSAQEVYKLT